jgi:hypothetical protein
MVYSDIFRLKKEAIIRLTKNKKQKSYQYVDGMMLFYIVNTYSRDPMLTNIMCVRQAENKLSN